MTDKKWFKRCKSIFSKSLLSLVIPFVMMPSCSTERANETEKSETSLLLSPDSHLEAAVFPTEVEPGTLTVVKVQLPSQLQGQRNGVTLAGEFEGIQLPFFATSSGYEALLGIPFERAPGPGKVKVRLTSGSSPFEAEVAFKVIPGHYKSEILHVDGSRVKPTGKKVLQRIIKEKTEVSEIYKAVTEEKFWTGPFIYPLAQNKITSDFGTKRLYNGSLKSFHTGVDLKAQMNTSVFSAAPGKVVLAKNLFFTGNTVMIDHGYGVITLYAHLNTLKVKKGSLIAAHELLGLSGKTGRVNGPHLHWQAVVNQVKINPILLTEVLH